jgi:hypothetical protein
MEFRNWNKTVERVTKALQFGQKATEQEVMGARPTESIQPVILAGSLFRYQNSAGQSMGYGFLCGEIVELPPDNYGNIRRVPCGYECGPFVSTWDHKIDHTCPACHRRGKAKPFNINQLFTALLERDKKEGKPIWTEKAVNDAYARLPVRFIGQRNARNGGIQLIGDWNGGGDSVRYEQSNDPWT